MISAALLGVYGCVDNRDGEGISKQYARSFDNRETVKVETAGAGEGPHYALYYDSLRRRVIGKTTGDGGSCQGHSTVNCGFMRDIPEGRPDAQELRVKNR